jgi:hypothetical protein
MEGSTEVFSCSSTPMNSENLRGTRSISDPEIMQHHCISYPQNSDPITATKSGQRNAEKTLFKILLHYLLDHPPTQAHIIPKE